jgi:hypothetical protein
MKLIGKYRNPITLVLAVSGIALMVFYTVCDTSCSYLKGNIWGIDLKWIGIAFMAAVIICSLIRQTPLVSALLAGGLGVEAFLIAFQFKEDVFCPFCLAFGGIVAVAFAINYGVSPRVRTGFVNAILYSLGEFPVPPSGRIRLPLLAFALLGYLFVTMTFSGSVTPAYGQDAGTFPAYGNGRYEVYVFTDYFCPPCHGVESDLEAGLKAVMATGGVRIAFVDMPIYKHTPMYAKYFLYAVHAGGGFQGALQTRRVLFSLADRLVSQESELERSLKSQGIAMRPYNPRPIFDQFNQIIKKFKVTGTPTIVIKYSEEEVLEYSRGKDIRDGLALLRQRLGSGAVKK